MGTLQDLSQSQIKLHLFDQFQVMLIVYIRAHMQSMRIKTNHCIIHAAGKYTETMTTEKCGNIFCELERFFCAMIKQD